MNPQTPTLEGTRPKGYLTFKAIKHVDGDRITYVGAMPVFDLIDKGFVAPVASAGLSPEILSLVATNGPVQRKTNPGHVQGIVDYIVEQAEKNRTVGLQLDRPLLDQRARLRGAVDRHPRGRRGPCRRSVQRRRRTASLPRLGGQPGLGQGEGRQAPRDQ